MSLEFFASAYFIGHRTHYLLFCVVALMAGIAGAALQFSFYLIIGGTLTWGLVALCVTHYYFISFFISLGIPLSFFAGALLCHQQLAHHSAFQTRYQGIPLSIRGTIISIDKVQSQRNPWHMLIGLRSITCENNCAAVDDVVVLYSNHNPGYQVADEIELRNIIFKKTDNQDFNRYLAKEKISATVFNDAPEIQLLHRPRFSCNRFLHQLRNTLFGSLQQKIERGCFALFSSIFLGNRAGVKKYMDHAKEPFRIWGTSHYLARSGLHLVIFGIIWHFILSLLPILFIGKQLILIALISLYSLLSWASVSFNRALIMFFLAKSILLLKTRLQYVHLITLATGIVLCANPLQLFYLDFQLSFGLTFALAWFAHIETHKKAI